MLSSITDLRVSRKSRHRSGNDRFFNRQPTQRKQLDGFPMSAMKPTPVTVPPNDKWPAEEIARLARTSGKPLEVSCAVSFLEAGWEAWLGTHFEDDGRVRELDILAEKTTLVPTAHARGATCTSRALVSCKGFPQDFSPLTYSVSQRSIPGLDPTLVASGIGFPRERSDDWPAFVEKVEEVGAATLLKELGLQGASRIVGFDTLEGQVKTDRNDSKVCFSRAKDGDRRIYGAIDSGLKATLYWNGRTPNFWTPDRPQEIYLHVPVCVLSLPMWDARIDGGKIGDPCVRELSYQTNFYPTRAGARQITVLVVSESNLRQVVAGLDKLHWWFCKLVEEQFPPGGAKTSGSVGG
jgi:hypothetical protein